ncbi:MAG: methyltransferase domain-containing protein [Deltaproteobacteria bacterium]|nr:methyltransferase domain-containing protein [Deltaproteobacteria bacterium]
MTIANWHEKFSASANLVRRDDANAETLQGIPDASLDVAVVYLNYHTLVWMDVNRFAFNRSVFRVLKPGGLYVVVDHRAKQDEHPRQSVLLSRFDEDTLILEVERAALELAGKSDQWRNPGDRRDRDTDPFACGDRSGTSDCFLVSFRKPETPVIQPIPTLEEKARGKPGSLYERLAGMTRIALIVYHLVERIAASPILMADPGLKVGAALPVTKFQLTLLMAQAAGGPVKFLSRGAQTTTIAPQKWEALLRELAKTLRLQHLPEAESGELTELLHRTREDMIAELYASSTPRSPHDKTTGKAGSLYERLGGLPGVVTLVEDLVNRNNNAVVGDRHIQQ